MYSDLSSSYKERKAMLEEDGHGGRTGRRGKRRRREQGRQNTRPDPGK